MAFTGSAFTGSAFVSGITAASDLPYNIIKLDGESIVDKLRLVDYAMTTTELDALSIADVYTWDEHTLLYAEFTNNLNAGSIVVASTIIGWNIIRYCCGSNIPQVIATNVDGSATSYTDYTAIKNTYCYYKIYPLTNTAVLAEIQSNTVDVCYDYYAFLDPTTGDSFTFRANLNDGMTTAVNSPTSIYEGFTQYPAKSQGTLNYASSTFSALLGDVVSSTYVNDTAAIFELLRTFITNGNEKIMKDRKGNIRRVFTDVLSGGIDEKPSELPTTINFSWTEVGSV